MNHEHEHDCIRISNGGGSVPGGSSDFLRNPSEVLEYRPSHQISEHALAALRELAKLRFCDGRMLSWLERHEPRAD